MEQQREAPRKITGELGRYDISNRWNSGLAATMKRVCCPEDEHFCFLYVRGSSHLLRSSDFHCFTEKQKFLASQIVIFPTPHVAPYHESISQLPPPLLATWSSGSGRGVFRGLHVESLAVRCHWVHFELDLLHNPATVVLPSGDLHVMAPTMALPYSSP